MGEEERLDALQQQIGVIERRIEYISDPDFLEQFSYDVQQEWEAEARELTSILNGKILEVLVPYFQVNHNTSNEFHASSFDPYTALLISLHHLD